MTNSLLDAVRRYPEVSDKTLADIYSSSISINQAGERLEYFIKDLVSDSLDAGSKAKKDAHHKQHLSWRGAQNHPPDMMIRGGESIEVKKSEYKHAKLSLNSSPPRQKLRSDAPRVIDSCRDAEQWDEKDMVYVIGSNTSNIEFGFMWMVYGDCWCKPDESYYKISNTISQQSAEALRTTSDIRMATDTNEIGKVRSADTLGRTTLRVRGMWSLAHPADYFSDFVEGYETKIEESKPLFTVMRESRFQSFDTDTINAVTKHPDIHIKRIDAPDPSNPQNQLSCVLIESI